MNVMNTSVNTIVDQVSQIQLSGNIIPTTWYKTIVDSKGKPKVLAIILLADIVYWYRGEAVKDIQTGEIKGYKKKFKSDLLQRSYRQIENTFGMTESQARSALTTLCELGVVVKHLRDETLADGMKLHNRMYLELIPERLKELTNPTRNEGVSNLIPPSDWSR